MAEGLDEFQQGGRTDLRAARGVLGEEGIEIRLDPARQTLVLQAARGEFRPPIEVSLQSKLGEVQTANTYCRVLSAPIPGVRSISSAQYQIVLTGVPRDDASDG